MGNLDRSDLINIISSKSDRYGNKILQFLDEYHLIGLVQAQYKQLYDFVSRHGWLPDQK